MSYEEEKAELERRFLEESDRIDKEIPLSEGLDGPHTIAMRALIREIGQEGRALNKKYHVE